MLPQLLYVCSNDGSDMRINKEIKSLCKYADIIFLGVGDYTNCYISNYCKTVILIKGKRNTLWMITKQIAFFLKLLITLNIKTVHIINEQLYIFFYPFLFFKYTVLDLFDSIFLQKNRGGEKLKFFKQILYWPANKIIVTDENRFYLTAASLRPKCIILPNYPNYFPNNTAKEKSADLRILYNGWLGLKRGTEVVEGLLKTKLPLKIYMAGWYSDDYTKKMVDRYPVQMNFLGILPQQTALEIAQQTADYILCVYAPINQNNINASPNKVYDAIQTSTPLIINAEIKVSQWVKDNRIGFVMDQYNVEDYSKLYTELKNAKYSFSFSEETKVFYTWETVEENLLKAHQLK